jgi:hypothetical protein
MEHSGALEAKSRSAGQEFFAFTKPCFSLSYWQEPDESSEHPFDSVELGTDGGEGELVTCPPPIF